MSMISELRNNVSREMETIGLPGIKSDGPHTQNEGRYAEALIQASLIAGLYPNLVARKSGDINLSSAANRKAKPHVSSVNSIKSQPLSRKSEIPMGRVEYVFYHEMIKGPAFFTLRNVNYVFSEVPILLLCGSKFEIREIPDICDEDENEEDSKTAKASLNEVVVSVDEWIEFRCKKDVANSLKMMRMRMSEAFLKFAKHGPRGLTKSDKEAVNGICTFMTQVFYIARK